jgi:23S rRNA (uracil1939-C5)-methyltransferase
LILTPSRATFKLHDIVVLNINGLNSSGDGIGYLDENHPAVFVPNTVPGDRIQAKITFVKRNFARAELIGVLSPSTNRVRPPCIVADKCGGCQWLAVDYPTQLEHKTDTVRQALQRIGKFEDPTVFEILAAPTSLGYRNKVSYPFGMGAESSVKAGYYQRGSHKLINLNQCPIQDEQFNPLLAELKQDIQARGWSIYDETTHEGSLRHLSFRIGRRTGDILITLISKDRRLPQLEAQAQEWLETYPTVVGVNLNLNTPRTNRIFGDSTFNLAGQDYLIEKFAGLSFSIQPTTFFQVFTEQAEIVVERMIEALQPQGTETVVDAYCGIGTLTLPIASRVKSVLGIEIQTASIQQAKVNAKLNSIHNAKFVDGNVDQRLAELTQTPDILVLDPPRKGCADSVIEQILRLLPSKIMYLTCNPATLSRDLNLLCQNDQYELNWVQPADFFPQTAHVESLAYLTLKNPDSSID